MRTLLLSFVLMLAFSACKKSEIDVIPANEAPPDETVSSVTIENYITRTYILVLGREPDSVEYYSALNTLKAGDLDSTSRHLFLNDVFADGDYRPHVYNENRIDLLNNMDTAEFTNWITLFTFFLADTTYQLQWPIFQYEIARLTSMRSAYNEFTSSTIDIDELQRRMCNNYFYDQINMGSANFVLSTFQHLINRNPTNSEQQSGISMVDGSNAVLFLQSGNSKNDYLDIITHSQSYYEGQVIFFYKKYLPNHQTTSVEMSAGAMEYSTTQDYTAVQKDILSTDEFIGL